ncbi:SRPBCC family protein [Cryptosporangium minutisporangium]|uniref:SRPBCC family protein n=1 Tax=Cryptosporangium minutisporangium TaxID=113569 RepID=A0ABP6T5T0_9ACTN
MEGTLTQDAGRYVLRIERRLAHPPARVWRALVTPAELSRWFPADLTGDLQPGGKLTFTFREEEAPPSDGTVVAFEPERLFEFRWEEDVLRWELTPIGDGCLLTLTHTFDDGPGAASFATGWVACLDVLAASLAGEPTDEPSKGWVAATHDRYVEAFGLREGVTESTGTGWQVRFVRQLTKPPADVWTQLSGPDRAVREGALLDGLPPARDAETDEPASLRYGWGDDPNATVGWELAPGPGGARAVLTVAGPTTSDVAAEQAYRAARDRLDTLAAQLRG